jgi:cytochrome c biogenesis protein CcmG/thiol:disulfide interchange protein DsbE
MSSPTADEHAPRRVRTGRALAFVLIATFVALLAYGIASKSPRTGIDEHLAQGRAATAPGFDLALFARGNPGPRLAGVVARATRDRRVTSGELAGTPYVLNFWASWCVPCRAEAAQLERAWRGARGEGVLFIGLNQQDLVSDARAFMRTYQQSYLNIRDPENNVALRWGLTGLPETYFVTARGSVVDHVIGAISDDQLRAGLKTLRSGTPRAPVEGGARQAAQ